MLPELKRPVMNFLVSYLEKLGISQKERQILLRVFVISFTVSICCVATIWLISFLRQKRAQHAIVENQTDIPPHATKRTKGFDLQSVDIRAHRYAADYFSSTNQPLHAISHYQRILQARPQDIHASLALATTYMEGGLFEESIQLFEKLLQFDNQDSLLCVIEARYGLALFHSGQVRKSISRLEECLKRCPHNAEAACFRGQVEASVNPGSSKTIDYFTHAIALDSNYTEAPYQLARYLMNRPQASRADLIRSRDNLLRVLTLEPLHAKAHSRLGMVYYYLQQPAPAQKSYETALALNPQDYNTHFNLGELYFTTWDNEADALRSFKRTVELKKDHTRANFRIGLISLRNSMKREAVYYLEQAHKSDPEDIRILLQLAVAYERLGVRDKAIQKYRQILSLDSLNDIARHKLLLLQDNNN